MKKILLLGMSAIVLVNTPASTMPYPVVAASQAEKAVPSDVHKNTDGVVEQTTDTFSNLKDITNHWASSAIQKGIERGYVSGYSDATFKPDAEITRAEFIKMVVVGIGIDTSSTDQGAKWYDPFINAAIQQSLITTQEYQFGTYNTSMTRMEMARLAVRAIGLTAKSDEEYMYWATSKGLISGVGNGKLAVNDTTTRAQAVVIIERMITVKNGGTLSVDQAAVKAAEEAMNAPKDPWGSEIRTTNVPSNASDFPYILKKWPNEMYGLKLDFSRTFTNATDIQKNNVYSIEAASFWADMANQWGTQIINVDYKTIDDSWTEKYLDAVLIQGSTQKSSADKFVQWVKNNQISIEGSLTAEPSIIQLADGRFYIRSHFRFRINNFKEDKEVLFDLWYTSDKYKKNQWYEGYADIPIVSKVYMGTYDTYRVAPNASLFRQGAVTEEK